MFAFTTFNNLQAFWDRRLPVSTESVVESGPNAFDAITHRSRARKPPFTKTYSSPLGTEIKTYLVKLGWTQNDLAKLMCRPRKTISELMHGRASLTVDTALGLEKIFGVAASLWLKIAADYEIEKARHNPELK